MNMKEIKEILQLMKEHELQEIEIEKEGMKLKLKKDSAGGVVTETIRAIPSLPMSASPGRDSALAVANAASPAPADSPNTHVVKSPMVGTFYAAPAPDQPNYVSLGSSVKEGDVLCIVEAMKLMNEIKAEVSGTVSEVLGKNGQPIEFDQPLFKIQKG